MFNEAFARLQIKKEAFELINELEIQLKDVFTEIEKVETLNQAKVLAAFQNNHVAGFSEKTDIQAASKKQKQIS